MTNACERSEYVPKKNFEAAVMLKMEYHIESMVDGSSIPCFKAASTSSLNSPFPEISFNWRMMQSVMACFANIFFSGKEKVEKLLGESSKDLVKPPLNMEVITPADTSVCDLNACFIVRMKCRRAFPCDDCL